VPFGRRATGKDQRSGCPARVGTLLKKTTKITRHPDWKVKADSYVLETNVHYPTDLNLLWDAARKSIEILSSLYEQLGLQGWRKKAHWKRQSKKLLCVPVVKSTASVERARLNGSNQP
jgi:hypothetical protein